MRESSHEQEAKQVFTGSPGRAVRLVREQRSEHPSMWAAVESIAPMMDRNYCPPGIARRYYVIADTKGPCSPNVALQTLTLSAVAPDASDIG